MCGTVIVCLFITSEDVQREWRTQVLALTLFRETTTISAGALDLGALGALGFGCIGSALGALDLGALSLGALSLGALDQRGCIGPRNRRMLRKMLS